MGFENKWMKNFREYDRPAASAGSEMSTSRRNHDVRASGPLGDPAGQGRRITTCSDRSLMIGTILGRRRCLDGLRINWNRGSVARCSGTAVEKHPEETPCNGFPRVRHRVLSPSYPSRRSLLHNADRPPDGSRFLLRRDLLCCPRGLPRFAGQIQARSKETIRWPILRRQGSRSGFPARQAREVGLESPTYVRIFRAGVMRGHPGAVSKVPLTLIRSGGSPWRRLMVSLQAGLGPCMPLQVQLLHLRPGHLHLGGVGFVRSRLAGKVASRLARPVDAHRAEGPALRRAPLRGPTRVSRGAERSMRRLFGSLEEGDRRRYAAVVTARR